AGGTAHNAIPRDAVARLALPPDAVASLHARVSAARKSLRARWAADEPGLDLQVREGRGPDGVDPVPERVLSAEASGRVLRLLDQLPHGVQRMSEVFPGKVETSSNLAEVQTLPAFILIGTSSRSFVEAELDRVQARIAALGKQASAAVEVRDGYPGWEPDPESRLLRTAEAVYGQVFGVPPEVEVIHAGLECGVIVSKLPGMEAISFGPLIRGAHTPEEHVHASTVASTWRLLAALLAALARPAF
ncbi:MAG TPA: hypothetical protein VK689_22625, partial [Armatimonadota bacterium]|nr:hypothetical protein [Armatimonadota bacterium]